MGWPIRCLFNDAFRESTSLPCELRSHLHEFDWHASVDHEVELGVNYATGNYFQGQMIFGMLVSRRYGRTSGLLKLAHDFPSLGMRLACARRPPFHAPNIRPFSRFQD